MKKLNLIFPIAAIAFVSFFIGLGLIYYQYSATVMRFPVIIGGLVVLFSVLVISGILRGTATEDDTLESEIARSELGQFGGACLWLLAILPALYLLGFPLGVPAYILVYMKAHGERWLVSLSMAALGFAITYFIFMKFLGVPLPAMPLDFM